jgi:hypothetical protein
MDADLRLPVGGRRERRGRRRRRRGTGGLMLGQVVTTTYSTWVHLQSSLQVQVQRGKMCGSVDTNEECKETVASLRPVPPCI